MNNESKRTGLLLAALAAIFFGLSSITAKMASIGAGGNGISIAFYRNLSVLPVLAAILKIKGYGFAVTKKQLVSLLFIGMTCGGLTAMLLYLSYDYISVGLTLCLHFLYPALVALFYAVFFKQKLTKSVAYSAYLIISDRSGVRELTGFKISFYNTLFGSIFLFVFGHIFGFSFTECRPAGWIWLFLTGLMVVCIGNVMTPEAVKRIGPTVTGILGILEPITSLVCSILLLGEPLTKRSLLGGILVLASAFLITLGDYKKGQE